MQRQKQMSLPSSDYMQNQSMLKQIMSEAHLGGNLLMGCGITQSVIEVYADMGQPM